LPDLVTLRMYFFIFLINYLLHSMLHSKLCSKTTYNLIIIFIFRKSNHFLFLFKTKNLLHGRFFVLIFVKSKSFRKGEPTQVLSSQTC
jgi:hypothetical protein